MEIFYYLEIEILMAVSAAIIAMSIIIAIVAIRSRREEDSLAIALGVFERRVTKAFDPPTAKQLVRVFRRQCQAERGESRHFYSLIKKDQSRYAEEIEHLTDFRVAFIGYVQELTEMRLTTKEAVAVELNKGQKVLTDFESYLAQLSNQLR